MREIYLPLADPDVLDRSQLERLTDLRFAESLRVGKYVKPASAALRAVIFVLLAFISKHAPGVSRMMHAQSDSGQRYLQRNKADARFYFFPNIPCYRNREILKKK